MTDSLDLLIFNVNTDNSVKISLFDSNAAINGLQKTVQQLFTFLLTDVGSVTSDANYGTRLASVIRKANFYDEMQFKAVFNEAAKDALRYFKNITQSSNPNENITAIELQSLSMTKDNLVMYVKITTGAGTDRTLSLPIKKII